MMVELSLSWLWYHGVFYVIWVFMVIYLYKTIIYIKNSPWFSSKPEYIYVGDDTHVPQVQKISNNGGTTRDIDSEKKES
jgi:hypothetical protein